MRILLVAIGFLFISWSVLAKEVEGINLEGIEPEQIAGLASQGSLLIVKLDDEGRLKEVVAGALVNAPKEVVWEVLRDFENYPRFMPQCEGMRIIEKLDEHQFITEQVVKVEIWVLKVNLRYQLLQKLDIGNRIRFSHISGDLPGTYGGYDFVPILGKNQTLLFYSLYSNLTALPWPIGPIMRAQPDFMTSANVSTGSIVVKAVKEEAERRVGYCK